MDISRFLASSIMDLRSMARGVAREPKPRSSRGVFLCGRALSRVRDGGRRASCARNTDRTVGGQLSRGAAQKRKFLVARPVSKNVTGEFHRAKTHPWWVHRKHHRSTDQLPSEAKRDFHLDPHIAGRHRSRPGQIPRVASHPPRRERFVVAREKNDLRNSQKGRPSVRAAPREVTTDALSPPDLVSDLGSRVGDGPLDPRQVPRRRARPRALPRQPAPRDPRRRGGKSRMVPDDVRDGGEDVPRGGEARA